MGMNAYSDIYKLVFFKLLTVNFQFSDSLTVTKVSNINFSCYLPYNNTSYSIFQLYYNYSNTYVTFDNSSHLDTIFIKIFPLEDSIFYEYSYMHAASGINFDIYSETFSGKKIK